MSKRPATRTIPTTRKTTMAPTLAREAQNSNSPNARADSRLMTSTTASAISTVAQAAMCGNQYLTYRATADSSAMPVSAQLSQYIQPVTKAAASPKNSRMYETNAPD